MFAVIAVEPPPGRRQGFGHDSRTIMNRKQRRRREKEDKAAEKTAASLLQRVAGFFDQGRLSEALKLCRRAVEKEPGNFPAQSNLGNVLARLGRTGLSAPTQGRFYSLTLANAQIQACGSNLPLLGAGTLRLWCIRESRTDLPQHWGKAWRLYPRTPSTTRDGAR